MSIHVFFARWIFWIRLRDSNSKLIFEWRIGKQA